MSENPEEMLSKSINPGGETQRKRHQSMEDLSVQQTTGIELARLLRVRLIAQLILFPEMQLILFPPH